MEGGTSPSSPGNSGGTSSPPSPGNSGGRSSPSSPGNSGGEVLVPVANDIVSVFGNATYTKGTQFGDDGQQPLSKIPPLHGQFGARWRRGDGLFFAEVMASWAAEQDRLSPADIADRRIPEGGTPGYFRVDVRGGVRLSDTLRGSLTLENLSNESYRVHGSGVDGAGFGVIAQLTGSISP